MKFAVLQHSLRTLGPRIAHCALKVSSLLRGQTPAVHAAPASPAKRVTSSQGSAIRALQARSALVESAARPAAKEPSARKVLRHVWSVELGLRAMCLLRRVASASLAFSLLSQGLQTVLLAPAGRNAEEETVSRSHAFLDITVRASKSAAWLVLPALTAVLGLRLSRTWKANTAHLGSLLSAVARAIILSRVLLLVRRAPAEVRPAMKGSCVLLMASGTTTLSTLRRKQTSMPARRRACAKWHVWRATARSPAPPATTACCVPCATQRRASVGPMASACRALPVRRGHFSWQPCWWS